MTRLYLSPPDMSADDRTRLMAAFDSNWITTLGAEVDGFEADVVDAYEVEAAVALASGTAALHLALLLHGVSTGDEVWVSTFTFVAPANAARYLGADLRFIDSETSTWNMDPDLLEDALERAAAEGRLPAAVVAVDLYGQCAQLDRITAACRRFDVPLVEDAAEAIGATWQGRHAGAWGALAAYSFNGNKIMTTGGGGMLVGDRRVDRAGPVPRPAGPPTRAALRAHRGGVQLPHVQPARRRRPGPAGVTARQDPASPRDQRGLPIGTGWARRRRVHAVGPAGRAQRVADADHARSGDGPATRTASVRSWSSSTSRPARHGSRCTSSRSSPASPVEGGAVAEDLYARGVCLPSGSGMTDADVERVVEAVVGAVSGG